MTNLGSSLAAIVTDRNTWQTRANNAWGSTRVWNSGTSFESAYNSEVTLYNNEVTSYNNMVTDRDTWQSRANNAWGSSRVWNSGESWEAAYNRVLPPASTQSFVAPISSVSQASGATTTLSVGTASENGVSATNNTSSVTIPKAGDYEINLFCGWTNSGGNSGDTVVLHLKKNGVDLTTDSHTAPQTGVVTYWRCRYRGTFAANDLISGTISNSFDAATVGGSASSIEITFIPNQTNPH